MSRDLRNGFLVTLPLSVALVCSALLMAHSRAEEESPRVFQQADLIAKVLTRLEQDYVERFDDDKSWELVYGGIKAMTKRLDPYSVFLTPEESRPFAEETHKNYVGVGFATNPAAPPITIDYVFDHSPAEKAGLVPGDRVVAIDGAPIEGLTRDAAIEKIKGQPGTTVQLTVVRAADGAEQKFGLERARIPQASVVGGEIIPGTDGVAYLYVDGFGDATVREFDYSMEQLAQRGMKALLLDLRSNNGGLLDISRLFANRFLRDGAIVSIRYRAPREGLTHRADPAECKWPDLPLVVLVNGDSASAAEIVAGALQDHGRALLVGERTYGKGVVQSIWKIPLGTEEANRADGGEATLKLTTAEYLTPSGRAIEKRVTRQQKILGGLEPDFTVRLPEERVAELAERIRILHVPARWRAQHLATHGRTLPPLRDAQVDAALAVLRGETPAQDF
ncbi:MAG: S41 family peptidase [Planctomycetes bacterium]|nr:S41 family peptidase [Planctomycetota bacterium]